MAQFARPDSDITLNSWEDDNGGTTNIYLVINEPIALDASYVLNGTNQNDLYECGMDNLTDPEVGTGHTVRYRYSKSASGGNSRNITVALIEGTTTIASQTHSNISDVWTAGSFTLDAGEANNITDYTNLRFRFTAGGTTGGNPNGRRAVQVSWAEFEVPDVATSISAGDSVEVEILLDMDVEGYPTVEHALIVDLVVNADTVLEHLVRLSNSLNISSESLLWLNPESNVTVDMFGHMTSDYNVNTESLIKVSSDGTNASTRKYFRYGEVQGNLGNQGSRDEISGMSFGIRNTGTLWTIDDSGGANVFAMGLDGSDHGAWSISGAANVDYEALSAATVSGVSYLYVGDVGDNNSVRSNIIIYRCIEPIDGGAGGTIDDVETITCEYPGTPLGELGVTARDCETLLTDPHTGDIYLISKRTTNPQIFYLPHQKTYTGTQTLTYQGDMQAIPEFVLDLKPGQYTGGDISTDGLHCVMKGIDEIRYFHRDSLDIPLTGMLMSTGVKLPYNGQGNHPEQEPQCEAACFNSDTTGYYTMSEAGTGSTVWSHPLYYYPEVPRPVTKVTFQEGVDSYTGCEDTYLWDTSEVDRGGEITWVVDINPSDERRGLLKFNNMFGDDTGQIPDDVTIVAARLVLYDDVEGEGIDFHKILSIDWNESSTYGSLGSTLVEPDNVEAASAIDGSTTPLGNLDTYVNAYIILEMDPQTITDWRDGVQANYGWVAISHTLDGIQISSAEHGTPAQRPKLIVEYYREAEPGIQVEHLLSINDVVLITAEHLLAEAGFISINIVAVEHLLNTANNSITGLEHLFSIPTSRTCSIEHLISLAEQNVVTIEHLLSTTNILRSGIEHLVNFQDSSDIALEHLLGLGNQLGVSLEHLLLVGDSSDVILEHLLGLDNSFDICAEHLRNVTNDNSLTVEHLQSLNDTNMDVVVEYLLRLTNQTNLTVEHVLAGAVALSAIFPVVVEHLLKVQFDGGVSLEHLVRLSQESSASLEHLISISHNSDVVLEYLLSITADSQILCEHLGRIGSESNITLEGLLSLSGGSNIPLETLLRADNQGLVALEHLLSLSNDALVTLEHRLPGALLFNYNMTLEHLLGIITDNMFTVEYLIRLADASSISLEHLLNLSNSSIIAVEHLTGIKNTNDTGLLIEHLTTIGDSSNITIEGLIHLSGGSHIPLEMLLSADTQGLVAIEHLLSLSDDSLITLEHRLPGALLFNYNVTLEHLLGVIAENMFSVEHLIRFADSSGISLEHLLGLSNSSVMAVEHLVGLDSTNGPAIESMLNQSNDYNTTVESLIALQNVRDVSVEHLIGITNRFDTVLEHLSNLFNDINVAIEHRLLGAAAFLYSLGVEHLGNISTIGDVGTEHLVSVSDVQGTVVEHLIAASANTANISVEHLLSLTNIGQIPIEHLLPGVFEIVHNIEIEHLLNVTNAYQATLEHLRGIGVNINVGSENLVSLNDTTIKVVIEHLSSLQNRGNLTSETLKNIVLSSDIALEYLVDMGLTAPVALEHIVSVQNDGFVGIEHLLIPLITVNAQIGIEHLSLQDSSLAKVLTWILDNRDTNWVLNSQGTLWILPKK